MEYKLKILSPLHIGCGEQLNGLNFILDGKKVYVVEPEAIIKLLGPEKGLKFAQWLEANSNEITRLDAEQWEEKKKDPKSEKTKTARKNRNNKKQNFTLRAFVDERS
jgi:CRISPR type III-A-associated RAMP protein Csm5